MKTTQSIFISLLILPGCQAFSTTDLGRRALFTAAGQVVATFPMFESAAVIQSSQSVFKVGQPLSMSDAEERLKAGRASAQYLFDNYDAICAGGGDNVRRYLGTVGTTSGLYGIGKALSKLSDRADDFVEYTELSDEVLKAIQQADGSAYMAIFVVTSTSQTPPSKYFSDAKIEIKRCIQALDELAVLVDVKI